MHIGIKAVFVDFIRPAKTDGHKEKTLELDLSTHLFKTKYEDKSI